MLFLELFVNRLLSEGIFEDNVEVFHTEVRDVVYDALGTYPNAKSISILYPDKLDYVDYRIDPKTKKVINPRNPEENLRIELLKQVPILNKRRIIKVLGAGKDGVAFLMTGDVVLKLGKSDGITYQNDKLHRGQGKVEDMFTYDQGIARDDEGNELPWYELPYLMSILDYAELTSNNVEDCHGYVYDIFEFFKEKNEETFQKLIIAARQLRWNKQTLLRLAKATHGWDSKPENTGVIPSSIGTQNGPIFIEFD